MAEAPNDNAPQATPPTAAPSETPTAKPKKEKPPVAEDKAGEAVAAKPKKEKQPALEDKPFAEFMQQHYLPTLQAGLAKQGVEGIDLTFIKQAIPINGFTQAPDCWQVVGKWLSNQQSRQFNIYFFEESLQGQRGFSYTESSAKSSTLESFMIDERKITLDLLVSCTLQRLNGQKWLARN
jgi:Protein of unknown function (DUF2996)